MKVIKELAFKLKKKSAKYRSDRKGAFGNEVAIIRNDLESAALG